MAVADNEIVIIGEIIVARRRVGRRDFKKSYGHDDNSQLGGRRCTNGLVLCGLGSCLLLVDTIRSESPATPARSRHVDRAEQPGTEHDLLGIHPADVADLWHEHLVCCGGLHQHVCRTRTS